jgi:hypothetical protein
MLEMRSEKCRKSPYDIIYTYDGPGLMRSLVHLRRSPSLRGLSANSNKQTPPLEHRPTLRPPTRFVVAK